MPKIQLIFNKFTFCELIKIQLFANLLILICQARPQLEKSKYFIWFTLCPYVDSMVQIYPHTLNKEFACHDLAFYPKALHNAALRE